MKQNYEKSKASILSAKEAESTNAASQLKSLRNQVAEWTLKRQSLETTAEACRTECDAVKETWNRLRRELEVYEAGIETYTDKLRDNEMESTKLEKMKPSHRSTASDRLEQLKSSAYDLDQDFESKKDLLDKELSQRLAAMDNEVINYVFCELLL
jgi:chromosome segregation ATPase